MFKAQKLFFLSALMLSLTLISCKKNTPESDLSIVKNVDPLIGTGFHGHTFPGAVVPFGRVQLSPDTKLNGWDACSGYHYDDETIFGFSHTHLSGTGIGDMGDILFLPFSGNDDRDSLVSTYSHADESAEVGLYSVKIKPWDVKCELTASLRTGWHRYTFPKDKEASLMIDLSHILQYTWGHRIKKGEINIIDNKTIEGFRLTAGWAQYDPIYFRAEFSEPFKIERNLVDGKRTKEKSVKGTKVKSFLSFGKLSKPLVIKVSLSAVDANGARANMKEIASLNTFDKVVASNKNMWSKALSSIKIETKDKDVMKNFYTALYHSQIAPMISSDADGRYVGMDHKIHKLKKGNAYTVYSLWDTFRAWYPLMTIIDKDKSVDWLYSLYYKYENGGMLPKWGLNSNYTGTMVGYPAVSLFADAADKGLITQDLDKFTNACIKAATWQPEWLKNSGFPNAHRVMTPHIYFKEKYGFVPSDSVGSSVSYGLEMAYYDYCVAKVAEKAGKKDIAEKFYKKAKAYEHYYDKSTGFMRGKNFDGSWVKNFNPRHSDHAHSDYVEGNAYQWTPLVPHDVEGLTKLKGGKEKMGVWLDSLFTTSSKIVGENASGDITGLIGQYAHGNEPSHHIAYMYHFTDRPWRTAEIVDQILYDFYKPTPDGIIGNEDCGQMSAWYVLNAIGFYQIAPGKAEYHLGRPIVDKAEIRVDGGWFTIEVKNNSRTNKYIKSATLNGKKLSELKFMHSDLKAGGKLLIHMSGTK